MALLDRSKALARVARAAFFPTPVTVADVNGDGKPDLLMGNYCPQLNGNCVGDGSVGVLLGKGDGTFAPAVTYDSGGFGAQTVVAADVNGDGKLDLVVANGSPNAATDVLLANGDGTFQAANNYPGGGVAVSVADLNGDGKPDLLAVDQASIFAYLNNGDGTFAPAQNFSSGGVGSYRAIRLPISTATAGPTWLRQTFVPTLRRA